MFTQTLNATPAPSKGQRYVVVPTTDLRPGAVLRQPVLDDKDVLLLAAGIQITEVLIQRLAAHGVASVRIHRMDLEAAARAAPSRPDARLIVPEIVRAAERTAEPACRTEKYDFQEWARVQQNRVDAVDLVADVFRNCDTVRPGDLRLLEDVAAASLREISSDADGCLSVETLRQGSEYPAQLGVQSSVVAMSIGMRLGLNKTQLSHLGVGCLIHDLGLLRLNLSALSSDPSHDAEARLEISKHPAITFDLLGDVARQAGPARLVAYQIHERCNGSGFPRGRDKTQIHPLARVAAVADTYVRRLSPFHGQLQCPYGVLVGMLRETKQGLFDPEAMRGLLDSVSLFAIGTQVELSDGRIGRVIRANPQDYMRPIVEAWSPSDASQIDIVSIDDQGPQILRAM